MNSGQLQLNNLSSETLRCEPRGIFMLQTSIKHTGYTVTSQLSCEGFMARVKFLVVLISLVVIFKKQLTSLVTSILSKITEQSNSI